MSVQKHRIVGGDESDIHDEPHLEGHRITVRQIVERVEERGLDPQTVAKRYNLPMADIYRALTYYYDHPEELEAVYECKREREQAQLEAMKSRGEQNNSTGQVPLSDHEREEIDFSNARASVPHARAVKAIAREQGIDDWLAHYDPTPEVDEHRSTFEGLTPSGGRRMDAHEERQAQRRRDSALK